MKVSVFSDVCTNFQRALALSHRSLKSGKYHLNPCDSLTYYLAKGTDDDGFSIERLTKEERKEMISYSLVLCDRAQEYCLLALESPERTALMLQIGETRKRILEGRLELMT